MVNSDETSACDPESLSPESLEQFSDGELLDAWTHDRVGDAFAVLVGRHGMMVLTVCRRKCRSRADADDAYQSTFLLLAKNSGKITRPECLAGWLHRVAHRASLATLARRESLSEPISELAMTDDPLSKITRQHDANVLDEELSDLPEQYRSVLVMQVYEDYSIERIAQQLQASLGSIRGRLQRGRRLLAQRLRRRGVVPIYAIAAAGASVISASEASAAEATLLSSLSGAATPKPPIPDILLNPVTATGAKLMTPWNAAGGLFAAGTLVAVLVANGFGSDDRAVSNPASTKEHITISTIESPLVAQIASRPDTPGEAVRNPPSDAKTIPSDANTIPNVAPVANQVSGMGSGMGGVEGGGMGFGSGPGPKASPNPSTVVRRRYRPVVASGPLAASLQAKMDQEIELQMTGTVQSLVEQLESQLNAPVILDQRAVKYAELDPQTKLVYSTRTEPLRTALRKLLAPLGLKTTIETEGLVITADHSQLVRKGIGTDRWLNVNDEMMEELEKKLAAKASVTWVELPLREAVQQINQQLDLPIGIDPRSLEAIGLSTDATVAADLKDMSGYDILAITLLDLDLTLGVQSNRLMVTTVEAAESRLLSRIYWLEGIGLGGDFDSMMQLIQSSIVPDIWEALGGPSTMNVAPGSRPGIIISTSYDVHRQIDQMIRALRENSFAADMAAEEIEVAAPTRNAQGVFGVDGGFM